MAFPLKYPLPPMEARAVRTVPRGAEWQFEPKWDGFRCLVFRDRRRIELQSKSGQPLTRYFPELIEALDALKPNTFVLDGEIVVPEGRVFSFDKLLQRIHPARSRVLRLAKETPALLIVFDLLATEEGRVLTRLSLDQRREALVTFAKRFFPKNGPVRLSPATTKPTEAGRWLKGSGALVDGIIAKRRDMEYRAGLRDGMQKIKNYRSADCVVGGFRYNEGKRVVGSLLLGLYNKQGLLNHVGFTSNIRNEEKPALTKKLEKLISPPGFTGNKPGGPSRWSTKRSAEWQPLKPKLVIEICYDHFSGGRFRHGTTILRWRPDKAPRQCTMDQVAQMKGDLMTLLR